MVNARSIIRGALLALALAWPLGGCAGDNFVAVDADQSERAIGSPAGPGGAYVLAEGDKIKLGIFGDDKVAGTYEIGSTGHINLPLIGEVEVRGMTVAAAAGQVARLYSEGGWFRDPQVQIEVASFRSVYVLGEVNKPGAYDYRPGLSLFGAVALAGGYTIRGDARSVFIRKPGDAAERRYELTSDIEVLPGDVIRIPQRFF